MKRHLRRRTISTAPRLECERLEAREVPATLYGLTNANTIIRFDSATPGTITNTATIQGLNAGELVVGIDFRPRTGQLYALAVNGNGLGLQSRLLTVNPITGVSTLIGTPPAFAIASTTADYGFDFNPTVDRIRVINNGDLNLRLNPNNGALAGTDTNLNPGGGGQGGTAYDRNYDGNLGPTGTTLYTISPFSDTLRTSGGLNSTPSPNTGTQNLVGPLGVDVDVAGRIGFDIQANGTAGQGPAFATLDTDLTAASNVGLYTINLGTGAAALVGAVGAGTTPLLGLAVAPASRLIVGTDAGVAATVEMRDGSTGQTIFTAQPFGSTFTGGVQVAAADVNRDSVPDAIIGAGFNGAPRVVVLNGVDGSILMNFFAYDSSFRNGVFVAGGDVNGDGFADIITGAGVGGAPHVKAFSGKDGAEFLSYFAYDSATRVGVRVAAADFNNDAFDEIVTAAGPGGGPHIEVFDKTGTLANIPGLTNSFSAYDPNFRTGSFVAAGDTNGDGIPDIITGADSGGGSHVRAFSGKTSAELNSFFAFQDGYTGGARVGVSDLNNDGRFEIRAAPGKNLASVVRAFDGLTSAQLDELSVLSGTGGVFVGGARV